MEETAKFGCCGGPFGCNEGTAAGGGQESGWVAGNGLTREDFRSREWRESLAPVRQRRRTVWAIAINGAERRRSPRKQKSSRLSGRTDRLWIASRLRLRRPRPRRRHRQKTRSEAQAAAAARFRRRRADGERAERRLGPYFAAAMRRMRSCFLTRRPRSSGGGGFASMLRCTSASSRSACFW